MNVQDRFICVPGVAQRQGAPTGQFIIQAEDNRSVALADIALGSLWVRAARQFGEGVFFMDTAVLGLPAFWDVSAVGEANFKWRNPIPRGQPRSDPQK
jgi:hypothetical protein